MKVISFFTRNVLAPMALASPFMLGIVGATVGAAHALNNIDQPLTTVDRSYEEKGLVPALTTVDLEPEQENLGKSILTVNSDGTVTINRDDIYCSPDDQRQGC